jgi:hypothetical protein
MAGETSVGTEALRQDTYRGHNSKGLWVVVRLPTDGELCSL